MGTMQIGYDVEWHGEGDVTPRFVEHARSLHAEMLRQGRAGRAVHRTDRALVLLPGAA